MKIQTDCVPCLLKRIIFEAEQSTSDKKLRLRVIRESCMLMSKLYDPDVCSASIATRIHKMAYEILGDRDPYKDLKLLSNKIAVSLVPKVEDIIKKSDDPLKASIVCSIIGNMMDFGIAGASDHPDKLVEIFDKTYSEGLGHDDIDKVKAVLAGSKNVLFFTDNCGEIVFDKFLCREIKKSYPDVYLTLVVKGEPILSDATMEDVVDLGFEKFVDEILTTGCYAVGVDFENMPSVLKESLEGSDLVICKGMANYESFSETSYKPIVYFLRVKCNAIARSMNLPVNINAVKLYK